MPLYDDTYLAPVRTAPVCLADLMPYLDRVAPGVVLNTDDSLMATLELTGPDLRAQPPEVQGAKMLQVNHWLRQLGWGWSLHSETQRFRMVPPPLPTTWGHPVAQAVAAEQHARLQREPLLESRHYVTLRYAAPSETLAWVEGLLWHPDDLSDSYRPVWQAGLQAFQTMVQHLAVLLRGIIVDGRVLDDTQVYNYLYSTMNLRWQSLRLPEDGHHMAYQLDDDPDSFGGGGERPVSHGRYLRTLSVQNYPPTSVALMLAKLNDLDIEYSWALRWLPDDPYHADKHLQKLQESHGFHRKSLLRMVLDRIWGEAPAGVRPMADQAMSDVQEAQIVLGSDEASFGTLTITVTVWDADWAVSEQKIQAAATALTGLGFGVRVERTNAVGAFLGSRPGIVDANPRKSMKHTLNVSHLMAVDAVYSGPMQNDHWHCPPLLVVKTAKSNPYRYVPHVDGIAHTFFSGPSTMGKSAWKDRLRLACQMVPEVQDIGYEVKGAGLTTTLCLNGRFDDLGRGDAVLQPYRYIDRPSERDWAIEWTVRWLEDLHEEVGPYHLRFIKMALDRLAHVEPSGRTISGFRTALAYHPTRDHGQLHYADDTELHRINHIRDRIYAALDRFCGGLLDGSSNGLTIQRVHTFELETLLEMPVLAKPVLRVVDHFVDLALDGRPTILWYDEIQALLDDIPGHTLPESIGVLNQRIRRARDKNVMLLAGTQNVEDLLLHKLGPVFLNNCPNKVFFPNPEALTEQNVKTYTALGLTHPQMVDLAQAYPRAQWLHKNPLGTRMVEYRFDPLAVAVCGRSGKAWHQQVQQVLQEVGPAMFPYVWLTRQGVWHDKETVHAAD